MATHLILELRKRMNCAGERSSQAQNAIGDPSNGGEVGFDRIKTIGQRQGFRRGAIRTKRSEGHEGSSGSSNRNAKSIIYRQRLDSSAQLGLSSIAGALVTSQNFRELCDIGTSIDRHVATAQVVAD